MLSSLFRPTAVEICWNRCIPTFWGFTAQIDGALSGWSRYSGDARSLPLRGWGIIGFCFNLSNSPRIAGVRFLREKKTFFHTMILVSRTAGGCIIGSHSAPLEWERNPSQTACTHLTPQFKGAKALALNFCELLEVRRILCVTVDTYRHGSRYCLAACTVRSFSLAGVKASIETPRSTGSCHE